MHNITDIANYFIAKQPMNKYKVQQLCYYYIGWIQVYYDTINIKNQIFVTSEHGPMNASIEEEYKEFGFDDITKIKNLAKFTGREKFILESIFKVYGDKFYYELEAISYKTVPFLEVYHTKGVGYPIDLLSIKTYFEKEVEENPQRPDKLLSLDDFKNLIKDWVSDQDIKDMFKNANLIPDKHNGELSDYEKFQYQWLIDHGYSLRDVIKALDKYQTTMNLLTVFENWEYEQGFAGQIYPFEDEYYDNKCLEEGDFDEQ